LRVNLVNSRSGKSKRVCSTCFALSGVAGEEPDKLKESDLDTSVDIKKGEGRKTVRELSGEMLSPETVLNELRLPLGNWNWALFNPTEEGKPLSLHNAGSLGIMELLKWLTPGDFYFGLLRLGFGFGRFRRTKILFIVWSPRDLSVSARSVASNALSHTRTALGGPFSMELSATALEDLSLEAICSKARALQVSGESVTEEVSVDTYFKALEEETKNSSEFFGGFTTTLPHG